ncbi:hypothetical protein F5884DRAFT_677414 [Xylogone sp. PMI_703]|nr:hypothetical protein F5884DRAFT_677414 [Xylogone sp. PMI_703]
MPRQQQNDSRRPGSRGENVRSGVNRLFSGESRIGSRRSRRPETPKPPRLPFVLPNMSSIRITLPHLHHTRSNLSVSSQASTSPLSPHDPPTQRPISTDSFRELQRQATTMPAHSRSDSRRRFVGVDPEELYLAHLAEAGRSRRKTKNREKEYRCAPKIKNRKIRNKIVSCFISGIMLIMVLAVYLALALTKKDRTEEFHVLLILIILIITIIFCHSLIRLCMMIINPPPDDNRPNPRNLPAMVGPGGFAHPPVPIPVVLARDEEAAGIVSETVKFPPPAYGLWRESVRVDPDRIFWQRNNNVDLERQDTSIEEETEETQPRTGSNNRPPSYSSEDGVNYILNAAPRSIAPTTDVPLPPHPSERGRVWTRS